MDVDREECWPGARFRNVRLLEEVPMRYPFRSRIYRSTFEVDGFPFCKRLELYCVVDPEKRALVIDTGSPALCGRDALDGILERFHISWDKTEVFLSHFHDDHAGNALYCIKKGIHKLYFGPSKCVNPSFVNDFLANSASMDLVGDSTNAFIAFAASGKKIKTTNKDTCEELGGGEILSCGKYTFTVLHTPGHTFDHLCLLDENKKILFAGDHICNTSPGVLQFSIDDHLISRYLENLALLKSNNLEVVYMSHHNPLFGPNEINRFISMIQRRYESLVARARKLFSDNDELTVREAAKINASHYSRGLEGLPYSTQIGRIATTFATLEYLNDLGMTSRSINDEGALIYKRLW